jgi:hypothetical protein
MHLKHGFYTSTYSPMVGEGSTPRLIWNGSLSEQTLTHTLCQ